MMTGTESSFRNVVFINKKQDKIVIVILIYHRHKHLDNMNLLGP
jgi:hypothetical protein